MGREEGQEVPDVVGLRRGQYAGPVVGEHQAPSSLDRNHRGGTIDVPAAHYGAVGAAVGPDGLGQGVRLTLVAAEVGLAAPGTACARPIAFVALAAPRPEVKD
ncbi:hypothetical protein ABZS66_59050 [Dactylosporangium sp. NPDC005572]|uniref:hypothetical protein n=1 Tax=Dactylosporangium sp. NPDC005572 TaxID=3156889 RepID=UPI0033B7EC35